MSGSGFIHLGGPVLTRLRGSRPAPQHGRPLLVSSGSPGQPGRSLVVNTPEGLAVIEWQYQPFAASGGGCVTAFAVTEPRVYLHGAVLRDGRRRQVLRRAAAVLADCGSPAPDGEAP